MKSGKISAFFALFLFPSLAISQTTHPVEEKPTQPIQPKVEVIASIAIGHPLRFDDRGFGNHPNLGLGVEIPIWRGLRAGGEVNRSFGLTPESVACGSIYSSPGQPMPCIGSAQYGVSAMTAASFTGAYFFGSGRVQPYVLGGISVLWTETYSSISTVRNNVVEFSERVGSDTGIGPAFGAGLRAAITRRLTIRPEIRFSDGTDLSAANLSQWRFSMGIGYAW
jgi:opacity protein-like surface antigen